MTHFAVLIMALPAAGALPNAPSATALVLPDPQTHVAPMLLVDVPNLDAPNFMLPSTLLLSAGPAPRVPTRLVNNWRVYFADENPALKHDGEFYVGAINSATHTGYRSAYTGLWDLSSQLHADIGMGRLIFPEDETTLRLISVATTSTRTQSWQPGFVIGIGTTW